MPMANSSRAQPDRRRDAEPLRRAQIQHRDGRLKNVWPPEMPVSRPRSTISMPRVTMKPLSPKRMISRALTAPMARPTARVTGTAQPPGSRPSPCAGALGDGQPGGDARAPGPWWTPATGPSARRSGPASRPAPGRRSRTSSAGSLIRLSFCRNTGLTMWPTTDAGDDRRNQREVAQPGDGEPAARLSGGRALGCPARRLSRLGRDVSVMARSTPSMAATSSWSCQPRSISPRRRPWNITRTRSHIRRSSSSSEATSTPVPRRAVSSTLAEQQLLGPHVHAGGRVDQHQQPRARWPAPGP